MNTVHRRPALALREPPSHAVPEICIYGGTFSPPHIGHVNAVNEILAALSPDRLYIVPAAIPPHKELSSALDNPAHRAEMLRLTFCDHREFGRRVILSAVELRRGGRSYTSETLAHFKAEGNLTFCCGTDMFLTIDEWHRPDKIFALARIALIDRYPMTPELKDKIAERSNYYREHYGARLFFPKVKVVEMSSTELRRRIAEGEDVGDAVSPAVLKYIHDNHLYEESK